MENPEILIVGAGPGGMTAGLYAARAGHRTLILEKGIAGGQVANTPEVENYPGFADPVAAIELAQAMEQQTRNAGCEIEMAEATGLKVDDSGIGVQAGSTTYHPGALIIATGVIAKQLGVPGEKELRGRGVSYCAVCDGPLFKGKEVVVVGGGDSALDEALYLAGVVAKVHLVHRRDEFRGTQVAQDRVRRNDKIELHLSQIVTEIHGKEKVEAVTLRNKKDGSERRLDVSGVFLYVGSHPNTEWCSDAVELDENGFVKTDCLLRTNLPGVFAVGDIRNTPLRQIATAVGDGALAATMAREHLLEEQ